VHALQQVVHLDTGLDRADFSWVRGTNRYLPPDIAVQWCRAVDPSFHARNAARSRRYAYLLRESPVRPALEAGLVGWSFRPLDGGAMQAAAAHLIGTHDFTSFRSSACQSPTPVKTVLAIGVSRRGTYWRFDFHAHAFLHHMVRNVMGCLVAVGAGRHPPDWMGQVLAARSRDAAPPTFAPDGLYFLGPDYDARFGLPEPTGATDWLP
jgi:tRNA pseudouridine38-40 synthase